MVQDVKIIYLVVECNGWVSLSDIFTAFASGLILVLIFLRLELLFFYLLSFLRISVVDHLQHFPGGSYISSRLEMSSHL
jgi:hypothetical protein